MIPGSSPIYIKQYRQDRKTEQELQEFVNELRRLDIIERSFSLYNHPVFLRPKPHIDANGKRGKRMVMNFVELNKRIIPYHYPLPLISDLHESLGQFKFYGVIDLSQSYHQIEVHKEDRHKLAFTVGGHHWQFKRGPMGIATIAGFFQAMLHTILDGLVGKICDVYQDDIMVKGRTKEEFMGNLEEVFERLSECVLKINPKKAVLMTDRVSGIHMHTRGNFPGSRVGKKSHRQNGHTTTYVMEWFSNLLQQVHQGLQQDHETNLRPSSKGH